MSNERYTIEELEQAFQHYLHSKTRLLHVAAVFTKQSEGKNESQIIEKAPVQTGQNDA
jgi:hypothetical protein